MKKGMIALVMNCKDEDNIIEWIMHHALVGFDKIIIFDDMSTMPVQSIVDESRLIRLLCKFLRVRLEIRREHMIKTRYMNTALNEARADPSCEWFMCLDADEYLMIPCGISEFLRQKADSDTVAVAFWWRRFGSSGLVDNPTPKQCVPVFRRCEKGLSTKLKVIVRPSKVGIVLSPHHYRITPPNRCTITDASTGEQIPNIPDQQHSIKCSNIYIAHYINQGWRRFCTRRSRPRDDTGCIRTFGFRLDSNSEPPDEFKSMFNDVQCDDVFERHRGMINDVISRLRLLLCPAIRPEINGNEIPDPLGMGLDGDGHSLSYDGGHDAAHKFGSKRSDTLLESEMNNMGDAPDDAEFCDNNGGNVLGCLENMKE